MYALIVAGLASMHELKTCYTLDEALRLYALWQMRQDIEAAQAQEMQNKQTKGRRR